VPGVQPAIMIEEIMELDEIVQERPAAVAASPGTGCTTSTCCRSTLVHRHPADRRRRRPPADHPGERLRARVPEDNGYARPVGNLVFVIDCDDRSVARSSEGEPIPLPPESGNYDAGSVGPLRTTCAAGDHQPDGRRSRSRQRHRVAALAAARARRRVEGLVISDVSYLDGDRPPLILHRASISEMVVPYGDTSDDFYFRNVFDAGEYNLGKTVGSLALGCDCLGEIRYLDAVLADESGTPHTITNAICIHEEDYGILWKHWNFRYGDAAEVRRSRRLVVSAIHTIGNYEYGFFWYFYLDGTIQFEAKLTGIVQTRAVAPGEHAGFGTLVAPQLDAPNHQHLFNMRLDLEVDGPDNTVVEVDAVGLPIGPATDTATPSSPGRPRSPTSATRAGSATRRPPGPGRSSTPACATASASRSATSSCRSSGRPCSPRRRAISPGAPSSPATPVGHPLRRARDARRRRLPQPAPRRRHRRMGQAGDATW
jgi:primary-amine oxidase